MNMKKNGLEHILIIGLFSMLLHNGISGQDNHKNLKDCDDGLTFHYVVTHNLVPKNGIRSERMRDLWIFMDERAFSEENLKSLFTTMSRKYPKPQMLNIWVETNWERVPIPSDCEGSGTSSNADREDVDEYHWAVFLRRGKDEIFRYNPVLKNTSIKTVVIKGTPF